MFEILRHEVFIASTRETLNRYRSANLEKRLGAELDKLCYGPRKNTHRTISEIKNPVLQGRMLRARVGRHRLILLAIMIANQNLVFPLYLSPRPRNGYDYENIGELEDLAEKILADFEARRYDKFARWACE